MTTLKYFERGMTQDEVRILLTAQMGDRERAYYRALYETFYRAQELLKCDIEDYNNKTGELVARHTKRKYNPRTKETITEPPKHMIISPVTMRLFSKVIRHRKKGPIFINRKGTRLSIRYLQQHIGDLALSLGIQKTTHITTTERMYSLVTLKALRVAGERHTDLGGADYETTAKAAQHSLRVKEKHYKKTPWVEIQETIRRHHPAFKES